MMYRISGLDPAPYTKLFGLPDEVLAKRGVVRMTVTAKPGFPCRVTLADSEIGEQVLLLNHVSHDRGPYRSSHAIFIAEGETQPAQYVDAVPPVFETRVLSLRGFDRYGMMAEALLAQPGEADAGIRELFANPKVTEIHAHNAARGCFAAKVERA